MESFVQKQNYLNLGPKMLYFGVFYCHISNQHPRICLISKFRAKIKILKFGIKNAWLEVFLGWKLAKLGWKLSYLKLRHSILYDCKFRVRVKVFNFGIKNTLFGHFWNGISKTIVIFEMNVFKFI